ncbi:silent information regulator family protein [Naegleria gruberi]|uniref:Silent information regulator family protein n=1 Tax=Naegleria gruberi TaxID=5762 RepID=D2VWA2_NAEGR|nr:silent information regulator family protein [Naegleria gruberi]EFC38796.1 silent information regulator family protein [Naegleria gruberi]|eukprot:XP_002671540.1 silent information regulator family protein [Naegleria gruberi strain NEG-M]
MSDDQKQEEIASEETMEHIAQLINKARRVVVFSGAGMSAESGIDTFRGGGGLWTGLMGKLFLAYGGTPFGWNITPQICWGQYIKRFYGPIAKADPNNGHFALAKLEQEVFGDYMEVITQNVDGLHQRAGSTHVYEVHGTVMRHCCIAERHIFDFDEYWGEENDEKKMDLPDKSPKCKHPGCNSTLRPDCVLFTEALPMDQWEPSFHAVDRMRKGDVMICVGTSAKVYPAASLPGRAARRGAHLIEFNLEETDYNQLPNYIFVKGPSGQTLPTIVDRVIELRNANQSIPSENISQIVE